MIALSINVCQPPTLQWQAEVFVNIIQSSTDYVSSFYSNNQCHTNVEASFSAPCGVRNTGNL